MIGWMKRVTQPVVRLTTVQHVPHTAVFDEFAKIVEQAALEERVKHEPRVVSFRALRGPR